MNPRRLFAISYRYFLVVSGNPSRMFQILVWGALDVIIWGFLTKYLNSLGQASFSFTPILLGAAVVYEFMTRAQQGVSSPFLEDVWSRNLLNFFASPLTIAEYVCGLALASICTSALSFSVITAFAAYAFGFSLWAYGAAVFAFLILMFVFGVSLGVFAISILMRFDPSAEWFVWPIPAILSPIVGVFYPITILPLWVQVISRCIPLTYVFENLRSIIIEHAYSAQGLLISAGLDLVFLALSASFFVYVQKRAKRSGAIARYSAESFS